MQGKAHYLHEGAGGVQKNNPFVTKGCKVNMNRFMGVIKKGKMVTNQWPACAFGFNHYVATQGLTTEAKVSKLEDAPKVSGGASSSATTDARALAQEKLHSMKTENRLVVAVVTLGDHSNEKTHSGVIHIMDLWLAWHEQQSHELRCVASSRKWLLDQLSGTFMRTVAESVNALNSKVALRDVGFGMPRPGEELNLSRVEEDNHSAESLMHCALSMAGVRMKRCAHMLFGVSARSILFLASQDVINVELARAKKLLK